MENHKKQELITFKVDATLFEALRGIENRSAFIRHAITSALSSTCPLCRGTGVLSEEQRKHWNSFTQNHAVERCPDCHALHLVCLSEEANAPR